MASIGTAECLSPGDIKQWLALSQGLQNWCHANDEGIALLLASVPPGTAECLSPGGIKQWLALPQGLQNRCQAHEGCVRPTIRDTVNRTHQLKANEAFWPNERP